MKEDFYFLDRQTGKVECVSREVLGIVEEGGTIDDVLEWQQDQFKVAEARFADWDRFEKLPTKYDIHEWEIMREFAESVEPERLATICKKPFTAAAHSATSRIRRGAIAAKKDRFAHAEALELKAESFAILTFTPVAPIFTGSRGSS
jgi:hypothetical protein